MLRFLGRLLRLPFHLVLIGVALGMMARMIYPPETEVIAPRQLSGEQEIAPRPSVENEEQFTDLPIK